MWHILSRSSTREQKLLKDRPLRWLNVMKVTMMLTQRSHGASLHGIHDCFHCNIYTYGSAKFRIPAYISNNLGNKIAFKKDYAFSVHPFWSVIPNCYNCIINRLESEGTPDARLTYDLYSCWKAVCHEYTCKYYFMSVDEHQREVHWMTPLVLMQQLHTWVKSNNLPEKTQGECHKIRPFHSFFPFQREVWTASVQVSHGGQAAVFTVKINQHFCG